MSLSAAQLKYILVLGGMGEHIRTADVAKILNVKRSSAFNMLVKLEEEEIVIKMKIKPSVLPERAENCQTDCSNA